MVRPSDTTSDALKSIHICGIKDYPKLKFSCSYRMNIPPPVSRHCYVSFFFNGTSLFSD